VAFEVARTVATVRHQDVGDRDVEVDEVTLRQPHLGKQDPVG